MSKGYLSREEAKQINNSMPILQNLKVGDAIRQALGGGLNPDKEWYVDGTNGVDATGRGHFSPEALKTIQYAIDTAVDGDTIYIIPKKIPIADSLGGAGCDPNSYAETLIIPNTKPNLSLIGITRGRTQGGLPQIKKGSDSTALLTVRAAGCLIANIGFNGNGSTGGGILLDDDGGLTKTAFGTTILNCHFKNCQGSSATNAATGGAITWPASSEGGAWQILIKGCRFYKNVGDIVMKGTSGIQPQDVIIEDCIFSGPPASVDCNIYSAAGGFNGIAINNCIFQQLPNIGSGTNKKFIILPTGSIGMITNCTFGCQTSKTGTPITFKVGGSGASFPVTVHLSRCYGQSITADETGEICIA